MPMPPGAAGRRRVAGVALAVPLLGLAGCSGSGCDELPALRAERDAARAAYVDLARGGASGQETARADEQVHRLDRQVHELEQSCG